MIPIYEKTCKSVYKISNKTFRIRIDCKAIMFKNDIVTIFHEIRDALSNKSDGVYRIFLTYLPSIQEITICPYPLEDIKDIYYVNDILVIKKGSDLTLFIPECDDEFDNIKCQLTFF